MLALATSGAWTSVAVLRARPHGLESQCVAEPAGADQSMRLLAMIGELLGAEGLASIDAIAFDAGPGAFTGLRVGCSVAQGLAFARAVPLVAVGSLEAAAWRSVRQAAVDRAVVLVANDARMGELYAAVCAVAAPSEPASGPSVEVLVAPQIALPDQPPASLSRRQVEARSPETVGLRWLLGGDAWRGVSLAPGWRALAAAAADTNGSATNGADRADTAPDPAGALPADAQSIAELGWTAWRAGQAVDPAQAGPRYVRDKVALDVDEQRQLREDRLAAAGATRR